MSEHVGDQISAYLDGELDQPEQIEVEKHIQACPSCHQLFEELSALQIQLFDTYQHIIIPDDLEQKVMNAIHSSSQKSYNRWFGLSILVTLIAFSLILLPVWKIGTNLFYAGFHLISGTLQIFSFLIQDVPYLWMTLFFGAIFLMMVSAWSVRRLLY
jgi:predicted anti-sigma-YlaC factor YlaD